MKNETYSKKEWLTDINVLRGYAILLVVVGHLPFLNKFIFYKILRLIIYSFHMPLFMMISGYIFGRFSKKKAIRTFGEYFYFLKKKIKKFIPAYLITVLILGIVKYFIGMTIKLKHPFNAYALLMMFINPLRGGFVTHLWFLYTLLLIFFLYPLLEMLLKDLPLSIKVLLYFMIYLMPLPYVFCLNLVGKYILYFYIGDLTNKLNLLELLKRMKVKHIILISILFVLSVILKSLSKIYFIFNSIAVISSLTGSVLSYYLVEKIILKKHYIFAFFNILGFNSFYIYLFHTLGTEPLAFLINHIFGFSPLSFILIFIFSIIMGLVVPILIKYIFGKFKINII